MKRVTFWLDYCNSLLMAIACCQVLVDTRAVQKDISMLSGKLDRTFIVTDELIFKVSSTSSSFDV